MRGGSFPRLMISEMLGQARSRRCIRIVAWHFQDMHVVPSPVAQYAFGGEGLSLPSLPAGGSQRYVVIVNHMSMLARASPSFSSRNVPPMIPANIAGLHADSSRRRHDPCACMCQRARRVREVGKHGYSRHAMSRILTPFVLIVTLRAVCWRWSCD